MRPPRQIPRPQFGFVSSVATPKTCGRCGQEYGPISAGSGRALHHLAEDGSGQVDAEMDRDHAVYEGDYHDPE